MKHIVKQIIMAAAPVALIASSALATQTFVRPETHGPGVRSDTPPASPSPSPSETPSPAPSVSPVPEPPTGIAGQRR